MSYPRLAYDLALSCFHGLLIGNLLFLPFTNVLAIPTILFGTILALPLFLSAFLLASIFRQSLEDHLRLWCVAAPFAVTAGWIVLEQVLFFTHRGLGLERYLYDVVAWGRAALAFTCAALAAGKFYCRNRRSSMSII